MAWNTLVDFLDEIAALPGQFLVYDNGYRRQAFGYREVAGMARAFALRLRAHGIGKGESVLIWSENRPGWIAALWGCVLEGVVVAPVDFRSPAEFLLKIAGLVDARALLAGAGAVPPEGFRGPVWNLAEIERDAAPALDSAAAVSAGDTVEIVFTSGATGEPKGVILTHANLLANMLPVAREIDKYKKYGRPFFPLRFLNLLPLSHLFGQAMALFIPPMLEGVVMFMDRLQPAEIVRQIHDRRVSVLVSVPKILDVLGSHVRARFPEAGEAGAGGGRWWARWWRARRIHRALGLKFWAFIVGAAPLEAGLERFWSGLGFVVVQGYGLTETAPIVTLNHPFHARSGSAGRPIGGVEVKIAPDGEILVRGPNVTSGYYRNPEASAQVFEDGWLHTGDLGEIAPGGELIVRGRKKDVIVTPEGLNVYPEDVERVLEQTPGVREAAVVGTDRVHAVLVLDAGVHAEEVVRLANHKLEERQRVRTVSVWPRESLPRTEGTAKLKRAEIRRWVATGEAPAAAPPESDLLDRLRDLAPGRTVTPETTLEELGLSSLERVELMTEIERRAGGRVDESALAGAARVADLLAIPAAPAEPVEEEYPRWSRWFPARLLRRMALSCLILPLTRYYARISVRGRENLDAARGPVILASNHQSHMDVPAILAALPVRLRYRVAPAMSKDFFAAHFHPAGHPVRERLARSLQYTLAVLCFNAFPLPQREAGAGHALHYAGELAAEGWWILIFPEGARTEAGETRPFRPGVAMLAARLGLPVVPVRIRGLERVLGRDARRATRGPVEIRFGAPLWIAPGDWRERAAEIERAVGGL
jgi:long-chain acyl-CoA synthetase